MSLERCIEKNTPHSKFQNYLDASEFFLKQRNFEDCRKYAQKAIEIDPNQNAPSRILSIANILLLSTTNEYSNYYFILNVPLYTENQQLIKTNFIHVSNQLNLNYNLYSFASEAFDIVLKAWSVLSSPTQKLRYDNELKNKEKKRNNSTFWTMCPYCYYVYEYLKDYEDCCLRCQNEKCRKAFHGVSIVGPPPPPEVAEKGEYQCFGFSVLDKSLWSPFVGTKINENNVESEIAGEKTNEINDVNEVIEISDDDEENENRENEKSLGVEKEFVETNGKEVDKEGTNMEGNVEVNEDFELSNVGENTNIDFSDVEFFMRDDIETTMREEFDIHEPLE